MGMHSCSYSIDSNVISKTSRIQNEYEYVYTNGGAHHQLMPVCQLRIHCIFFMNIACCVPAYYLYHNEWVVWYVYFAFVFFQSFPFIFFIKSPHQCIFRSKRSDIYKCISHGKLCAYFA